MTRLAKISVIPVLLLGFGALAVAGPSGAGAQEKDAAAPIQLAQATGGRGEATCMKCHDKAPVTLILHSSHGQKGDSRTPFADRQCQSCHGTSENHLAKPPEGQKRASPDVVFGQNSPTPVARQNETCLNCHEGGVRMNWPMGQHKAANVSCASCHSPHQVKDKVLVKASQPDVCFSCHSEQRAQTLKRSHHPIREGKVACSDCHNPHGSFGPKLLTKNTVNDTCFQCHAEKRGPFLWEHAPVADNCANCHTPHGSAQPRLLKVRTPMLCQECHSEGFHPSTAYSGTLVGNTGSNSWARLAAKGCLNCHPQIHGTNHPSGPRLTR